jgi:formate dehydrogenase subunit delta
MDIQRLVTMANEIAAFFDAADDAGNPAQSVASHLRRFWDPRMRRQILEHVANGGGEGLVPSARRGVELLAAEVHR